MRSSDGQRLGDFQYRFLKAVEKLEDNAFGPAIQAHLEREFGERINPGQLYTTADRLHAEGFLATKENQLQKNGRRATLFICTDEGRKALDATRAYYKRLIAD